MRPSDGPSSHLADLRLAIEHRIQSLAGSLDDIIAVAMAGATDDEHDPEGHTIAWERQQIAALLATANEKLAEISAAEARLARGSYGRCTICEKTIGAARLEALPATALCLVCAAGADGDR